LSPPSVLLIAPFDDAEHAHSAQRARALERLGCDVTTFDLQKRPGLLGRLAGSDLRSRLLKSLEVAEARLALVIGGYELDEALIDALRTASGVKFANWFPGDMAQIGDMLRCARGYDAVFVAGTDVAARTAARQAFADHPPRYATALRSFVTPRGGEYLFVPGTTGLRALATL